MSKFEQFFASKKLMLSSFIIALIAFAFVIVMRSICIADSMQSVFYAAFAVIMFFITLSMYRSFTKHETNSMNIVTGAAIGILLIVHIQCWVSAISNNMNLFDIITSSIQSVLYAILLINHVQVNSIHKSARGRILFNQIILLVIAAYQIILMISYTVLWVSMPEMMIFWIAAIAGYLARLFISFMIICIETKLNAYKIDRDVAKADGTWTDEKKAETKEKYFGK